MCPWFKWWEKVNGGELEKRGRGRGVSVYFLLKVKLVSIFFVMATRSAWLIPPFSSHKIYGYD